MTTTARLKHHAALVDRMATARGLDLQEAALRADLTPSDLSDMVLRCVGCARADHCAHWLDDQGARRRDNQAGAVSAPPDYCRNAPAFASLAKGSG